MNRTLPTREELMRRRQVRFHPRYAGNTTLADIRAAIREVYSDPVTAKILRRLGKQDGASINPFLMDYTVLLPNMSNAEPSKWRQL